MVGPRAKLLQKLAGLKRGARVVRRQSSLWSARQHDGRSCADKCKQCNCCCPHGTRAARYKLTPCTRIKDELRLVHRVWSLSERNPTSGSKRNQRSALRGLPCLSLSNRKRGIVAIQAKERTRKALDSEAQEELPPEKSRRAGNPWSQSLAVDHLHATTHQLIGSVMKRQQSITRRP